MPAITQITKVKPADLKWKDHGQFALHYGQGAVHTSFHKCNLITNELPDKPELFKNSYQEFLFKRVMKGLGVYSPDQLYHMVNGKKQRIKRTNQRAMSVLNLFKQSILNKIFNHWFLQLWGENALLHNEVAKYTPEPDEDFHCYIRHELLGIDHELIVKLFIINRFLPYNFYELTDKDDTRNHPTVRLKPKPEALDGNNVCSTT